MHRGYEIVTVVVGLLAACQAEASNRTITPEMGTPRSIATWTLEPSAIFTPSVEPNLIAAETEVTPNYDAEATLNVILVTPASEAIQAPTYTQTSEPTPEPISMTWSPEIFIDITVDGKPLYLKNPEKNQDNLYSEILRSWAAADIMRVYNPHATYVRSAEEKKWIYGNLGELSQQGINEFINYVWSPAGFYVEEKFPEEARKVIDQHSEQLRKIIVENNGVLPGFMFPIGGYGINHYQLMPPQDIDFKKGYWIKYERRSPINTKELMLWGDTGDVWNDFWGNSAGVSFAVNDAGQMEIVLTGVTFDDNMEEMSFLLMFALESTGRLGPRNGYNTHKLVTGEYFFINTRVYLNDDIDITYIDSNIFTTEP